MKSTIKSTWQMYFLFYFCIKLYKQASKSVLTHVVFTKHSCNTMPKVWGIQ